MEVRVADFPPCWESCGNCATEELEVVEIRVTPGATVDLYDCLLVLEASKIELEIYAPCAGTVAAVLVEPGDEVQPEETLLLLAPTPL